MRACKPSYCARFRKARCAGSANRSLARSMRGSWRPRTGRSNLKPRPGGSVMTFVIALMCCGSGSAVARADRGFAAARAPYLVAAGRAHGESGGALAVAALASRIVRLAWKRARAAERPRVDHGRRSAARCDWAARFAVTHHPRHGHGNAIDAGRSAPPIRRTLRALGARASGRQVDDCGTRAWRVTAGPQQADGAARARWLRKTRHGHALK